MIGAKRLAATLRSGLLCHYTRRAVVYRWATARHDWRPCWFRGVRTQIPLTSCRVFREPAPYQRWPTGSSSLQTRPVSRGEINAVLSAKQSMLAFPEARTVAILGDTHGLLRPELTKHLSGIDLILHSGDVGQITILHRLKQYAPVVAVRGNVDDHLERVTRNRVDLDWRAPGLRSPRLSQSGFGSGRCWVCYGRVRAFTPAFDSHHKRCALRQPR